MAKFHLHQPAHRSALEGPAPKGIFLGVTARSPGHVKEAVDNLRRLCAEAGPVAVFRTDFAAFDSPPTAGFSASIGTGGSLRHIIPPDEAAQSIMQSDKSPSVLVPDLIHFFKGSTLAKRYANCSAPAAGAQCAKGRRIDTFLGHRRQYRRSSPQHPRLDGVAARPVRPAIVADRAQWWQGRCDAAVANHDLYNQPAGLRNAFQPPRALTIWAERLSGRAASGNRLASLRVNLLGEPPACRLVAPPA